MPLNETKLPSSAFGTLSAPGSPAPRQPLSTGNGHDGTAATKARPASGKRPPKRHPAVGMPARGKQTDAELLPATSAVPAGSDVSRRSLSRRQTLTHQTIALQVDSIPTPSSSGPETCKKHSPPSSAGQQLSSERHVSTAQADQLLEAREKYRKIKRDQQLKVLQDLVIVQRQMMDLRAERLKEKQAAREHEKARKRAERMNRLLSRLTYTPVPPSTAKHHDHERGEHANQKQQHEKGQQRVPPSHPPAQTQCSHPSSPRHHPPPAPTPAPSTNAAPTPAATPGSPFRRRSIAPTPTTYMGGPISNADILIALEAMVDKYANAATHELGMVVRNHEQANAAHRAVSGTSKQLVERRAVSNRMVITAKSHREVGARLVAQSLPIRMLSAVEAGQGGTGPTTAASTGANSGKGASPSIDDQGVEMRPTSPPPGLYSTHKSTKSPVVRRRRRKHQDPSSPRRRVPSNPYSLDSWFAMEPTALLPKSKQDLPSTMSKPDLPTLPAATSVLYSDEPWNLWTAMRHTQRQSQIHGHVAAPLAVAAAINLDTSIIANATLSDQLTIRELPAHATMPWEPVSLAAATPLTGGLAMSNGHGMGGGQSVRYANTQARELYRALPQLEKVESLSSVAPRVWDTAVLVGPAVASADGDARSASDELMTAGAGFRQSHN